MTFAGVIEGFYGRPWSREERLDLVRFCAKVGFDTWVHAPKDDPYHRKRWRDPYPDAELAQLGELVDAAATAGVSFEWAIAPGLSVCYTDEREYAALAAKGEQLRGIGVRAFHLLWDDIEHDLRCPGDRERYGGEASPSAAAQAELSNRFFREALAGERLVVCPMRYAGTEPTPYRDTFGRLLASEVLVYWTGPEVVPAAITRHHLGAASAAFGHELVLWDNYPVNDFNPERLFLGPLCGRDPALPSGLAGAVWNPLLQAVPSKLPLATAADYVHDPAAYAPLPAFERALKRYGAEVVAALRELAGEPARVERPRDLEGLVAALAPGVDAATALALLEPFS